MECTATVVGDSFCLFGVEQHLVNTSWRSKGKKNMLLLVRTRLVYILITTIFKNPEIPLSTASVDTNASSNPFPESEDRREQRDSLIRMYHNIQKSQQQQLPDTI